MRTSSAGRPAPDSPGRRLPARFGTRLGGAAVTTALGLGLCVVVAAPAHASSGTSTGDATWTGPDQVTVGQSIHIEGDHWLNGAGTGGSTIGVKLDSGNSEPSSGPVENPATHTPATGIGIWAAIQADNDGDWSADIAFPTAATTNPAITDSDWAVGTSHHLRLLTGSMQSGDTPRSVEIDFTVAAAVTTPTISPATGTVNATTGAVSAALSGSGFTAGTVLTAKAGDTALNFSGRGITTGPTYTIPAGGQLSGVNVGLPDGTRAGSLSITVHGDDGTADGVDLTVPVTVNPAVTWSNGANQSATGTLTFTGLPSNALISQVKLGDSVVASNLVADADGTATGSYAIPADQTLGTSTVTITQTGPAATYTLGQKVSPDATPFNEDAFDQVSTAPGAVAQGLYQSAYSAKENALYVTTAYSTTATADDPTSGWDGTIYKLDPDTLAVEASQRAPFVSGDTGARYAPYGVAVDDVNGKVWVTNTRQNTVSVYDESTLAPVASNVGTVSHSRDVVYDPGTNQVFVSSASEGTSGDGYISVFEAADNNHNGTPYEKIEDIQTGPRTDYSPVSLALDSAGHKLFSPSLSSDKVAVVDTRSLGVSYLTLPGLDVGGRGASGIAYDKVTNRLFVASQNNDELLIANASTGATIKEVPSGAGALNVAFDPVNRLVYVANFGGTTLTVTDVNGNKVANLAIAKVNHVSVDGRGNVYAVDKNTDNAVHKITSKQVSAATPSISGTVQVGRTVSAVTGSWTAGTSFAYQWLKDGAAITGATKASYAIPASLAGAKLSVKVTGSKAGYTSVSKTSAAKVVAKATLVAAKPAVKGTAKVGQRLTANPGKWTAGTSFAYQWLRNGKAIKGATKSAYKVANADIGARLSVKVTGSKAGYTSVSKTSSVTKAVPKLAAKISAKLAKKSVSKRAKAKLTVVVKASGVVATGRITVFDGKKKIKVAALNRKGKATITLPRLKAGKHALYVSYAGNAKVAGKKSGKITLKVTR